MSRLTDRVMQSSANHVNNSTALSTEVLLFQSCCITGGFSRVQGLSLGKRTSMEKTQMQRRCPIKRTLSPFWFWDDGAQEEMLGTVAMTPMIPRCCCLPESLPSLPRSDDEGGVLSTASSRAHTERVPPVKQMILTLS